MDSLVGYGSDDDNEYDNKYDNNSGANANISSGQILRRDDDTNYDDVTMDMSEESDDASSQNAGRGSPRGVTQRSPSVSSDDDRRRDHVRGSDSRKRDLDGGRGISRRNDKQDEYRVKERSDRDKKRRSRSRSSSRRDERERNRRGSRERRDRDRHGNEKSSSRRDRSVRDRHRRRRESPVSSSKRGLLGDRPTAARRRSGSARRDSRSSEPESPKKVPALMDLKPFGGDPPPTAVSLARDQARRNSGQRYDERARERQSSPRRSSRERDKDRRRERDRDGRRGHEKSSSRRSHGRKRSSSRSRRSSRDIRRGSRSRGRHSSDSNEGKSGSSGSMRSGSHDRIRHNPAPVASGAPSPPKTNPTDYRPSYKVSKKLQVMEKMGLQIKTPDGSMATAQMLMARTLAEQAAPPGTPGAPTAQLPSYYNPGAVNAAKIVHQVQKRKLLWGRSKGESSDTVAPAPAPTATKWQGTMFAQDSDGKVATKFMRLMGIKDPVAAVAVQPTAQAEGAETIRKQEELFSAMQAQYDVARATTHTMRGVGLGFQGASTFPRQF